MNTKKGQATGAWFWAGGETLSRRNSRGGKKGGPTNPHGGEQNFSIGFSLQSCRWFRGTGENEAKNDCMKRRGRKKTAGRCARRLRKSCLHPAGGQKGRQQAVHTKKRQRDIPTKRKKKVGG